MSSHVPSGSGPGSEHPRNDSDRGDSTSLSPSKSTLRSSDRYRWTSRYYFSQDWLIVTVGTLPPPYPPSAYVSNRYELGRGLKTITEMVTTRLTILRLVQNIRNPFE